HQWRPDALRIEQSVPEATRTELEKRGHTLNVVPMIGVAQAIVRASGGTFYGAADPRVSGAAAGF
ncbi:MAG: gamma-glutamyltransferase, partial [Verrucomicrobiaceae bacterium]